MTITVRSELPDGAGTVELTLQTRDARAHSRASDRQDELRPVLDAAVGEVARILRRKSGWEGGDR